MKKHLSANRQKTHQTVAYTEGVCRPLCKRPAGSWLRRGVVAKWDLLGPRAFPSVHLAMSHEAFVLEPVVASSQDGDTGSGSRKWGQAGVWVDIKNSVYPSPSREWNF